MTKEEYQEKLKEKAKLETEFFKLFIDLFIEYPNLKSREFSKDHIAKIFDKNSFFQEIKNLYTEEITKSIEALEKNIRKRFFAQLDDLFNKINDIENELYKYDYYEFLKIDEDEYLNEDYRFYTDRKKQLLGTQIYYNKPSIKHLDRCSFYDAVMNFLADYFNNSYYFEKVLKDNGVLEDDSEEVFGLNEEFKKKMESVQDCISLYKKTWLLHRGNG